MSDRVRTARPKIAKRLAVCFLLCRALCLQAQIPNGTATAITAIRSARMLDVKAGRYISDAVILVQDGKILEAGSGLRVPAGAKIVDLGGATVLPGLIDVHTHLLARMGSGNQIDAYVLNLAEKSQAYRALEGAANARQTLEAGFTTVRDVESEGAGYADVALRTAIDRGLVDGPRMQVATRAIAATGGYFPLQVSPDLSGFPRGAQMITGADEARRAVREQIYYGADLIKIYADFVDFGSPHTKTQAHETLTIAEIRVIVEEAHKGGHRVAAHAMTRAGIRNAVEGGVDSIEHGTEVDKETLALMASRGTFLVPTTAGTVGRYDSANAVQRASMESALQQMRDVIAMAKAAGVRIACGFDASTGGKQGKNAAELAALVKLGMTPLEAIRAATVTAAQVMGWQELVGSIDKGKFADLIEVAGDPLADISVVTNVGTVIKEGVLVKRKGE